MRADPSALVKRSNGPMNAREPLSNMLPQELASLLGVEMVDARRLFARAQKDGAWPDRAPATLRRIALDRARAHGPLPGLRLLERRESKLDPFVKYAFETHD
jgi:23S rRNA (adenine2503-C2)-methyltransferase